MSVVKGISSSNPQKQINRVMWPILLFLNVLGILIANKFYLWTCPNERKLKVKLFYDSSLS